MDQLYFRNLLVFTRCLIDLSRRITAFIGQRIIFLTRKVIRDRVHDCSSMHPTPRSAAWNPAAWPMFIQFSCQPVSTANYRSVRRVDRPCPMGSDNANTKTTNSHIRRYLELPIT